MAKIQNNEDFRSFVEKQNHERLISLFIIIQLGIMELNWIKKSWVKHQEIIYNENSN